MRISDSYKTSQTSFGNLRRKVFKPVSKGFCVPEFSHNCDTAVYRLDMDWKKLCNFIATKFKDVPRFSLYNYGCSNLSEAYTFLIQMFSDFGSKMVEKFSPIIAKDRDLTIVRDARDEYLPMSLEEVKLVNKHTGRRFFDFFEKNCQYDRESYYFKPNSVLKDNVRVGLGDITKDYVNIPKKDSVIMARNFWVYLTDEERAKLAQDLYNHLEGNNVLILGHHDYRDWDRESPLNAINLLKKAGFKETEIPYVLTKD